MAVEDARAIALEHEVGRACHDVLRARLQRYGPLAEAEQDQLLTELAERDPGSMLNRPPEKISFADLAAAGMMDPQVAIQAEQRIRTAARAELWSGTRAAKSLQADEETNLWEYERFLALRDQLAAEWNPRSGLELVLIDQMAMALTEQFRWTETLALRQKQEYDKHRQELRQQHQWMPQRVSEAAANEQAMVMLDRWNRIFLRTLRALRDLRRYAPTINIQSVAQVNLGTQQINVAPVTGDG
jgi:hypothetical protein